VQVASKVGNLPTKFGHARPLGSRIIRYIRDRQTDGQTGGWTKQCLLPFPYGRGHNKQNARKVADQIVAAEVCGVWCLVFVFLQMALEKRYT